MNLKVFKFILLIVLSLILLNGCGSKKDVVTKGNDSTKFISKMPVKNVNENFFIFNESGNDLTFMINGNKVQFNHKAKKRFGINPQIPKEYKIKTINGSGKEDYTLIDTVKKSVELPGKKKVIIIPFQHNSLTKSSEVLGVVVIDQGGAPLPQYSFIIFNYTDTFINVKPVTNPPHDNYDAIPSDTGYQYDFSSPNNFTEILIRGLKNGQLDNYEYFFANLSDIILENGAIIAARDVTSWPGLSNPADFPHIGMIVVESKTKQKGS